MKLKLIRQPSSEKSTQGVLYLDDVWECFTLEDVVRPVKIPKETAIPEGSYKVVLDYSNRYKRIMPHILNVPNFEGIRIHAGNTMEDTEGCILVGRGSERDKITQSRLAFNQLFEKLSKAQALAEGIDITITSTQ